MRRIISKKEFAERMGRSVRHLIDVVGEPDQQGVELVVLAQGIDTASPGGG